MVVHSGFLARRQHSQHSCHQPHYDQPNWGLRETTTTDSVFLGRLDIFGRARPGLSRAAILSLNRIVNFLAVDRDRLRSLDSEADFVAPDIDNRHHDIVADHDAFVSVPGKDEHIVLGVI